MVWCSVCIKLADNIGVNPIFDINQEIKFYLRLRSLEFSRGLTQSKYT